MDLSVGLILDCDLHVCWVCLWNGSLWQMYTEMLLVCQDLNHCHVTHQSRLYFHTLCRWLCACLDLLLRRYSRTSRIPIERSPSFSCCVLYLLQLIEIKLYTFSVVYTRLPLPWSSPLHARTYRSRAFLSPCMLWPVLVYSSSCPCIYSIHICGVRGGMDGECSAWNNYILYRWHTTQSYVSTWQRLRSWETKASSITLNYYHVTDMFTLALLLRLRENHSQNFKSKMVQPFKSSSWWRWS